MEIRSKYDLEEWEKQALEYDNDLHQNFYKIVFKIMLNNLMDRNQIVPISKDNSDRVKRNYDYFQELLYKI